MKTFQDKVAAITGAGSGMGRTLAVQLAQQGCQVALSDVNETGLAETVALASEHGVKVSSQRVDVSDRNAMHAWADTVVAEHGKVNLIFNNAGVAVGSTVEDVSYEDFEWIMGINFWGVVHGTKAFLPHIQAAGEEGHIINTSSVFGLIGVASQGTYNATKFAVRGFTDALRQELDMGGGKVSATCVHPGGIKTNIAQSARFNEHMSEVTGKSEEDSKAAFEKMFITTADKAAKVILKAVKHNKRRVMIGPDAYLIDWMARLTPAHYQGLVRLTMTKMI